MLSSASLLLHQALPPTTILLLLFWTSKVSPPVQWAHPAAAYLIAHELSEFSTTSHGAYTYIKADTILAQNMEFTRYVHREISQLICWHRRYKHPSLWA
mmetsp:Transcript_21131/g.32239  ORF Transcript_21131/g.32239 Transcript_21131/m.32239 type:complete len:99 (-) Transcript_21131:176-472(-)